MMPISENRIPFGMCNKVFDYICNVILRKQNYVTITRAPANATVEPPRQARGDK